MSDRSAFLGGLIALGVVGVLMLGGCIMCKVCLVSRRMRRRFGVDKFVEGHSHNADIAQDKGSIYNKNITSHESQFMLKMQQGDYVGYEALERDINITKLSDFVSKDEGLGYTDPATPTDSPEPDKDFEGVSGAGEDLLMDMSRLKEAVITNGVSTHTKSPKHRSRHISHSFHNSYTIYEETSDLSGNESKSQRGSRHSDLGSMSSQDSLHSSAESGVDSDAADFTHSDSSQSFTSTIDLLDHHIEDGGLGQVEYTLQYHRDKEQVVFHIIQARNLEFPSSHPGDRGVPDCFIKTFATNCQDHSLKKQTKICKGTSNPVFKETFLFRISNNELHAASITLQVFTRDHYARQKLVGEICVELSPMLYSDSYRTWSNVIDYDHQPPLACAEVNIGLHYNHNREELHVYLDELRALRLEASPVYKYKELYLAVTLLDEQNQPRVKKKTSCHSVPATCHSINLPSHDIIFRNIPHLKIHDTRVLVELCQQYPDRSHDTMGYTILGAGTTDLQYGHWLLMTSANHLQTPATHSHIPPVMCEQAIYMWHHLHVMAQRSNYKPRFTLR